MIYDGCGMGVNFMQIQSMHRLLRNGIVGSPSNLDKARNASSTSLNRANFTGCATSSIYVAHEAVQFEIAVPRPVPMNMHSGPLKRTREESNIEDDAWEKFTIARDGSKSVPPMYHKPLRTGACS